MPIALHPATGRKGFIIVTFGMGVFMLCGFAGLALDVSYLHMWKRKAQTAADAAAQSAAIELKRTRSTTTATAAARTAAQANGFTHGADATVELANPPTSGAYQGDVRFLEVTVRKPEITPAPLTSMPGEDDPLAWRVKPTFVTCDHINFRVNSSGHNNNNPINMDPGVYCGGMSITGSAPINGTDVTFFNTESGNRAHGNISISGGATINLRAPRSGPYEALLIFEDRNISDNGPNHFEGSSSSNIEGMIYMPNSTLNFAK